MTSPLFTPKLSVVGRIGSIQRVGSRVVVAIHDEHGTTVGTVALAACDLPVDRAVRLAILPEETPS
jgi:hypothetical protein